MVTIELINSVLSHIGEQKLTTSTGSIGQLVRSIITTAIYKVVQETRCQTFDVMLTYTATSENYQVPIGQLPLNVIQVYSVYYVANTNTIYGDTLARLNEYRLHHLNTVLGYALVGSNIHVSSHLAKPVDIRVHALVAPTLPVSDEADSGLPDAIIPAIVHTAAAILCVTYLDDPNAAAIQTRIAGELTNNIRNHYGAGRGRMLSLGY
jgi:hypothetical protein